MRRRQEHGGLELGTTDNMLGHEDEEEASVGGPFLILRNYLMPLGTLRLLVSFSGCRARSTRHCKEAMGP